MSIGLSRKRRRGGAAPARRRAPPGERSWRRGGRLARGGGRGAVAKGVARVVALLAARRQLDEREVERRAAAVTGLGGDVALLEHPPLVDARVELPLHPLVGEVLAPPHEGVHRALRAI